VDCAAPGIDCTHSDDVDDAMTLSSIVFVERASVDSVSSRSLLLDSSDTVEVRLKVCVDISAFVLAVHADNELYALEIDRANIICCKYTCTGTYVVGHDLFLIAR
jgi:hypothetical protein